MNLQETVELFLLRGELRPKSKQQYAVVCKPLIAQFGGQREIDTITEADLMRFQNSLSLRLAPVTVANYTSVYKAIFSWACEGEYILKSPARRLVRKRPKPDPDENKSMPPAELRKIVAYAKMTHVRNYAALMVLLASGIRVGGLLSMTWERTDVENQFAWVDDKGGGVYKALFGEQTAAALSAWRQRHPSGQGAIWTGKGPKHEPLKSGAVYALFKDLCDRAGVVGSYHPHCLRHSRGHGLGKAGVPISVIKNILNHSDEKTTAIYQPNDQNYVALIARRHELIALEDDPEEAFRSLNILRLEREA